ncbi:MAG: tyrosine-type recombinase/integrase [Cryomorphaceae bacterium]|nr:tyrosine-type recombinase/integrase [Cryomorphaceae bacterium]
MYCPPWSSCRSIWCCCNAPRSDGRPFNKHVGDVWARAVKKAGLRHRPSYQLRHSYISNCLQACLDPGWIAKQVGHSNLKMIFEVYGRYIPTEADRNVGKLNDLFSAHKQLTDIKAM